MLRAARLKRSEDMAEQVQAYATPSIVRVNGQILEEGTGPALRDASDAAARVDDHEAQGRVELAILRQS